METSATNIYVGLLSTIEGLEGLAGSLQKEFEYFASTVEPTEKGDTKPEKELKAKKNQLSEITRLAEQLNEVFDLATGLDAYVFNLQACLLYYGVCPAEVDYFTDRKRRDIEAFIREYIQNGTIHIPRKIQPYLNGQTFERRLAENLEHSLEKAELEQGQPVTVSSVRFANGPAVPFEYLQKLKPQKKQA